MKLRLNKYPSVVPMDSRRLLDTQNVDEREHGK